ncbi:hypothetical protein WA158_004275 [Blastocystis sp. Blastoise]
MSQNDTNDVNMISEQNGYNNPNIKNVINYSPTWKCACEAFHIDDYDIQNDSSYMPLSIILKNEYYKIPKILIEVLEIKYTDVGAYIRFTDYTDTMSGTLHPNLVKDYSTVLNIGCVVCFQNVSVLYPSSTNNKYLIFCSNNIVKLFPKIV